MRWQHDTLQPSHGVAEVIDTPECWFLLIIVLNSHLRSCTPSDTNLANSAPLWCLPHHHTYLYLQCIQVTGPHSNWNTACKDFHSWPGRLLCQLVNSTSNCIGPRVRSHLWLLLVGARQIPNTNLPIGRAFVRENSDLEGVNAQALRKQNWHSSVVEKHIIASVSWTSLVWAYFGLYMAEHLYQELAVLGESVWRLFWEAAIQRIHDWTLFAAGGSDELTACNTGPREVDQGKGENEGHPSAIPNDQQQHTKPPDRTVLHVA